MCSDTYFNEVSVVIATLGLTSLNQTIISLNMGSLVPKEILICIPEKYAANIENLNYENVKIFITNVQGQVAQRALGFQHAQYPYVLQLDDDVKLDYFCLENLLSVLKCRLNVAVGPMLYDSLTKEYHSYLIPSCDSRSWFSSLFYYVANGRRGYQPGKISKSGINFGLPEFPGTFYDVDWLCGGCLLHRKENLVLTNFYPLPGKAYAEDLFHSNLLRSKKIVLVRCGDAKCYVDFSSSKGGSALKFVRNFWKSTIALKILFKSNNGKVAHLYLISIFLFIRIILKNINQKIGNFKLC
jgi:GT2 family glycosyltransferase